MKLESTELTPEIIIDINLKTISVKGVCTPENPIQFFEPIVVAVNKFLKEKSKLNITFELDYFNTGSSKCLFELFRKVVESGQSKSVVINWHYVIGDEEMKEAGELFSQISKLDFTFIEVPFFLS
jgi:hypothetical protein